LRRIFGDVKRISTSLHDCADFRQFGQQGRRQITLRNLSQAAYRLQYSVSRRFVVVRARLGVDGEPSAGERNF
jgi:hypothetical protein